MNSCRPSTAKRKERIWASLLSLLEEKPLDEVTVEDICQRADIHRTTFYNHFRDIYDLISYGTAMMLPVMLPEETDSPEASALAESLLRFMTDNRRIITNLLRTSYAKELFRSTDKVVEEYFINLVRKNGPPDGISAELCVRFYSAGLAFLLLDWTDRLSTDTAAVRNEIRQVLTLILHSQPFVDTST